MLDLLRQYMPHAHCWAGDAGWIVATVIGHGLTALAYLIISVLVLLVAKRAAGSPRVVAALCASFVLACGIGHGLAIADMYAGRYRTSTVWLLLTAAVSLATAGLGLSLAARFSSRLRAFTFYSRAIGAALRSLPDMIGEVNEAKTLAEIVQSLIVAQPDEWLLVGNIETAGARSGRILAISPSFAEALGYSVAELQAVSMFSMVVAEDRTDSEQASDADALSEDGASFTNRWSCADGSALRLRWTGVYHEDGNPVGMWRAERA